MAYIYDAALTSVLPVLAAIPSFDDVDLGVILVNDSYVFDRGHQFLADVADHEIDTAGYERQSLTGLQRVLADHVLKLVGSNVMWEALGDAPFPTVGGAVLFLDTGSEDLDPLVAFSPMTVLLDGSDELLAFPGGVVVSWRDVTV